MYVRVYASNLHALKHSTAEQDGKSGEVEATSFKVQTRELRNQTLGVGCLGEFDLWEVRALRARVRIVQDFLACLDTWIRSLWPSRA